MDAPPKFSIEKADPELHSEDLEKLIRELADFERMPEGPRQNAQQLETDLRNGHFRAYVAVLTEDCANSNLNLGNKLTKNSVVGFLIFYYAYSTWEGKYMFVEDVYVKPECRSFGIGTAFWKIAAKIAHDENLPRIEWNVLAWNENAIRFYNRLGGVDLYETEKWIRFRLDRFRIQKMISDQ